MPHKLLDLTKKKWDELKKAHNVKKKGALEAFFTKLSGINVGDAIDKFRKAYEAGLSSPGYDPLMKIFKAAEALEKKLTQFATQKEFKSPEAAEFKKAVEGWAKEASDYAHTFAVELKRNEKALKAKDAERVMDTMKEQGLL